MTRLSALVLAFAMAGALSPAAPPNPAAPSAAAFTSDSSESDLRTGVTVFRGSCRYLEGNLLVTADEIDYDGRNNLIVAIGNAIMTRGEERLLADRIDYYRLLGSFAAQHVRIGRYPFYIQGESAEGSKTEIVIHHASISYTDPGKWKPSIKAETIIYSPGRYLRLARSLIGLHNNEFVPLGQIRQDLTSAFGSSYFSLGVGYRSSLGGTADIGLRLPVITGAKFGGDLGIYTYRGVMFGPSADYTDPSGNGDIVGYLRSGWIHDFGRRLTDVLGNPIPENRDYTEWRHQEKIGDDLTLNADFNWWSDSDIIRDFDPKRFYPVQNPDNYLESVYTGEDYFASVFARFRINTWEATQDRLPELSFDLLPEALGGGFFQRLNASGVRLYEDIPTSGAILASTRLDAFYEISRPLTPTDWFSFTPVVGARITDYSDTTGASIGGGYLRTLGEIGFDAQLRSSGTFNYQNPIWEIDGLRHLLTPILSYRYIPDADKGQAYIPQIDTQTFNTYLPPLDLGDLRYLDQLQPVDTLRIGLNNTLQTREEGYGSRDLLTLDFADDFHFHRTSDQPDFSDLHLDLAIKPARWLEYDITEIFSPATFKLTEFTSGLVLRDGDEWFFQVGNDFVRHENDNYLLNYSLRLNEVWQVTALAEYDARIHVINRVTAGLSQSLVNTWKVTYMLTFNGGPNREGNFGFQAQLDILRF